ncbi:hypothetical protein [Haloimpatiens massiliensis]|uniref:hypothetical protein n=1 Tax=Haloimpatiens massiliensis TaxID=1658110 RepID=UPI000C8205AE|nr:hypothetical protein [Haloimpatiens massiliensis]
MNNILSLKSYQELYRDNSFIGKVKDRFKITYEYQKFIKELNLSVININIPSNVHPESYNKNIKRAENIGGLKYKSLAPDVWRILDYKWFNDYQKRLFAFSVVKSVKLFLRLNFKNIRSSCIGVIDAGDYINKYIIEELCKFSNNVVLVSKNIEYLGKVREYLIARYGVTPVITREYEYLLNDVDFIITSINIDPKNEKLNIWYIDDRYMPQNSHNLHVNNVTFTVPWEEQSLKYTPQLVGAILSHIAGREIEADLKSNDIYINEFGFNP